VIEGRVAQILSDHELIINRGRKDGVMQGMHFSILIGESLEIKDPETGESLGALDRTKAKARVTEVHERFAVCERLDTIPVGGLRIAPAGFFAPKRRTTGLVIGADTTRSLLAKATEVEIGDRVKQTSESTTVSARPPRV